MSQLELWTEQESIQLQYHEQVIEKGLETFYEVGQSLSFIREKRLYRKEFKTFEEYCQEKWGRSRRWANLIIKSSEVIGVLESGNHGSQIPEAERQARPLTKLDTPEQQAEAWENAIANSESGKPTAKEVAIEVEKLQEKIKQLEESKTSLESEKSKLNQLVVNQKLLVEQATNEAAEQKRLVERSNVMLQSEAERIAKLKAEKLSKEYEEKLAKELEAAKSDHAEALAKFKANPDPETKKALEKLKGEEARISNELDTLQRRLKDARSVGQNQAAMVSTVNNFFGLFENAVKAHPNILIAVASPLVDDAHADRMEDMADFLEEFAGKLRKALTDRQFNQATQVQAVEVEIVEDDEDLEDF